MRNRNEMFTQLRQWGESTDAVRAIILTSSKANPNAVDDLLSDYDVWCIVSDFEFVYENECWYEALGPIIATLCGDYDVPEEERPEGEFYTHFRLVLYHDGVRVDFAISSVEALLYDKAQPVLKDDLNYGYLMLLDKDGIADGLAEATYRAFLIEKPTASAYRRNLDDFWWDITYVAKSLWRDEVVYAKYMFDSTIRLGYLEPMIEWYIGLQHGWAVGTNKHGRWFKRFLSEEMWAKLEAAYAGADIDDNWRALFAMTDLYRELAIVVSEHLGYEYDMALDQRVSRYLHAIRRLDKDATAIF